MSITQRWLLPEGIDELMPEQAAQLESLRRQLIDKMQSWGYQLVFPPLVEYLDSLLTGTGKTLDLQTFKLTDQMSGRLMGIRADMTPQVARIAAHNLRDQQQVLRLCYIGNVLHTLPQGQGTSRNPIQLGAEIYGHAGPESDMEIVKLMVETLNASIADSDLLLDMGHVGIYRGLAEDAGLTTEQEQALFTALQRKALPEIEDLLRSYQLSDNCHTMLLSLAELNGDVSVLARAKEVFSDAPKSVKQALATLQTVADMTAKRLPNIAMNFDLAELRGYHYHTGIVFAAYQLGSADAIAMGGRYDDIGADFGHAQPATGFSMDLKSLVSQMKASSNQAQAETVEWSDDEQQKQKVEQMRSQGKVVIYNLPTV
ncbi:MAG: ATP phosphoribosyltransferase regulatory subunit [Piscirickettsiaceae bacterium]|nr:ATP phosphoribosyltransferase regulatory subunit [Piscirickettsiaceae bacterium]